MKSTLKIGLGIVAVAILLVLSGTFYRLPEGPQALAAEGLLHFEA